MKKKIFFLSQLYPYPPDGGGKIKTLNTLRTLAPHFTIFAIFISEERPSKRDLWQLEKMGIKIKVFYSNQILASVKEDFLGLAWHFIRGVPHYVFQYTHKPAFPYIEKMVKQFQPDVIHVDHLNLSQYLPKEKREIWILEHHNVEFYLYWTRFVHSGKLTRKMYLLIEMCLTYMFERRTIRRFDHAFAISQVEANRITKFFGMHNVTAQPPVYPLTKVKRIPALKPYILFLGNLGWPPNEDAVEWFLKEILPKITEKIPNVEFHVVGKRQPMYESHWPKPKNLFLHGYQKSLTSFLGKAHVFVMPFRMGGGLRIKGLTALAAGLPVVTTYLGVEGLSVKNEQEVLLANTLITFTQAVIKVLKSLQLQRSLSKSAVMYLKKHHSEIQNQKFLAEYQKIIQKFL